MKGLRFFIVFVLLALTSCKQNATDNEDVTAAIQVKVAAVTQRDMAETLSFNGVTRYQKREDIRASVTGYVSWMPFERGDVIKRGQTFAQIRTKEQDALRDATQIDSSLAKFTKPLTVSSNATGVITQIAVNTNDYVSEGDMLATVSQPQTLVVQVSVPYEYNDKVEVGTPCEVLISGDRKIDAKITGALSSIDSLGQAQHYLIALPEADLPENLNVQVKIVSKEAKNALTVPQQALQTNELITKFWVMKVVRDSLAVKEEVTPLLQNDSLVQIRSSGVKLHDLVIVEGGYEMQDSTVVNIVKQ